MLKLADNPPIRSEAHASVREMGESWWVAHTKARNEKALAWDLVHKGVPHFLPMIPRETFSGGRKRRNLMPLFNGYVFFTGGPGARQVALRTDRVAAVIPVPDGAQLVAELAAIEAAIESGQVVAFYPKLAEGVRVRVTAGPLKGVEGVIIEAGRVTRIVLHVRMLGRGASVEVSGDLLEVLA